MAQSGVYRGSIFEAFQPFATKRQIRQAIAHAKQLGLYSIAHHRDAELGTYYQIDPAKYASFQAALKASVPLAVGDDVAAHILATTQALRAMVAIAGGFALVFFVLGGFCLITGHLQSGRMAWVSALSIGGIWLIQQRWARALL